MDRDTVALVVNGVLAAGILAAYVLHKLDLTTTVALLAAASAPGAGNALLVKLADALSKKPADPGAK